MKKTITIIIAIILTISCLLACGKIKDTTDGTIEPTLIPSENTEYITTLYTEFDVSCVKKLADYKNLKMEKDLTVTSTKIIASYADVMQTIYEAGKEGEEVDPKQLEAKNKLENMLLREGLIEKNDLISFDYLGKVDGVAFEGGTANDVFALMGAGSFIPGFEESIMGQKIGTTFDIKVTFPENYDAKLAGKEAVFTITVHFAMPRLSEESVKLINECTGTSYKTQDEYVKTVMAEIKALISNQFDENFLSYALNLLYKGTEFGELPKSEIDNLRHYYEELAKQYSFGLNEYMTAAYGYTTEEQINEFFNYNVSLFAIISSIVQKEGFTISDEEYNTFVEAYAKQYGFESIEEFEKNIDKNSIYNNLLVEKVNDLLLKYTEIETIE